MTSKVMKDILFNLDAIAIERQDGSIRLLAGGMDCIVTDCEQDADEGHWGHGIHMNGFPIVVSNNPLYIYSVLLFRGFGKRKHFEQMRLF